ncbi:MAG: orotidine-5'-phosphate decarboxylase [Candidatus Poseidoniaceae archaeon]|nr:orotidine-5'-phosphate decarboxylase [Candidatus Poseidoniaceae archaeon]MDP7001287.1 orotidine-5'-phosphate decarboxylase [Candidatus Poseidoniaceae archaeon]
MRAEEAWGERWQACTDSLSRRWMDATCTKQSLVVLAADRYTMDGLNRLLDEVKEYVVALKTHVDLVEDWSPAAWAEFINAATATGMLIFEDRKHGDIGKIARDQMAGIYDTRNWADLVTAHLVSGASVLDGLHDSWQSVGRDGGVLALAQMSSAGNLLGLEGYTDAVVEVGKNHPACFGFIGNGSRPNELQTLREMVGEGKMIWTPGVHLSVGDGELGQRYGDPRAAVLAGSDGIIVGSGIHRADDVVAVAKKYADVSWQALLDRGE